MVDAAQLKELRRLTNAGLSDCKRALDEADGDFFTAAVSMLTEEDVHALKSSLMVRESAGDSIKDPVTDVERELISALESHFIAQRTRPAHVGFLFESTSLFLGDKQFRRSVVENAARTLNMLWRALGGHNAHGALPEVETVETPRATSTVVTMPAPQSKWECDYVVLMHPRRRLVFSSSARVIAIYNLTNMQDRGSATIEEMTGQGDDVRLLRRWFHENAEFTPAWLAEVVLDDQLGEVT